MCVYMYAMCKLTIDHRHSVLNFFHCYNQMQDWQGKGGKQFYFGSWFKEIQSIMVRKVSHKARAL